MRPVDTAANARVSAGGGASRGGRWLLLVCLLNTAALLYLLAWQQDDNMVIIPVFNAEDVVVESSQAGVSSSSPTTGPSEEALEDARNVTRAFLVDTPACRIPNLTPVNPSVQKYLEYQPSVPNCSETWWELPSHRQTRGPPLVQSNLTAMWVVREALHHYNVSHLSRLACCYRPFWRVQQDPDNYTIQADRKVKFSDVCIPFNGEVVRVTAAEHEYLRVECSVDSSATSETSGGRGNSSSTGAPQPEEIYRDFHVFVPLKPHVEERCIKLPEKPHQVNVLILGLDAVSRLNMLRQMPLLHEALTSPPFSGIEILGFNKIGDNTFPNVMAMLTGLEDSELKGGCPWPSNKHKLDPCPFIWKEFAARGYRTALNEDMAFTFTFCKTGFVEPPTDYYGIPFSMESREQLGHTHVEGFTSCLGSRSVQSPFHEYLLKFAERFRHRRFFGFFWTNFLCHNHYNMPHVGDARVTQTVRELRASGVLETTVLVVCSDHGSREGNFRETYQGQMEERLPFMIVVFPEWFKRRFPEAVANVRRNARNRLVTQFDVHETLRDLLDPPGHLDAEVLRARAGLEVPPDPALSTTETSAGATVNYTTSSTRGTTKSLRRRKPRGISLFLPIPPYRDCKMASIPPHYCTCQASEQMAVSESVVQQAAQFVVASLNLLLREYRACAELRLAGVRRAQRNVPLDLDAHPEETRIVDYLVALETQPGGALFEATVRQSHFDPKQNRTPAFELAGPVSRINKSIRGKKYSTSNPVLNFNT